MAAECCASVFARAAVELKRVIDADAGPAPFRAVLEAYLSPEHRDAPGAACPTATLAVDAARQGELMQAAYAKGIATFLDMIEAHLALHDDGRRTRAQVREDAIGLLANLVGSIVMARGVGAADAALSEEILAAGRKHLPG